MSSPTHSLILAATLVSSPLSLAAVTSIDAFSTDWTRIDYANNGLADPIADSNGQNSEELVGDDTLGFFFTDFNDFDDADASNDVISFRTRHAETKNGGSAFTSNLFIGIDADQDFVIDAFVGVSTSGNSNTLFIANPEASSSNNSVNSSKIDTTYVATPIISATNFNWRAVTEDDTDGIGESLDIDGGGDTDYYLSFQLNFSQLAAVLESNSATIGDTVTASTGLRYIVGTSTQNNSLNKDVGGLDGNSGFGTLFSELPNVTSELISADGVSIVPEPSSSALLILSALGYCGIRRRK